MADQTPNDYVIPVVREEVHTDAVPVETGGVRVVKRVETHDEVVEREIRRGLVDVKRVAVNQPVAGPLEPRREGKTLIVPVVSEVLRIEKQWVLTEEIHITQTEESQTVTETVPVNVEHAEVQRFDEAGRVISELAPARTPAKVLARGTEDNAAANRRVLSGNTSSIVKKTQP